MTASAPHNPRLCWLRLHGSIPVVRTIEVGERVRLGMMGAARRRLGGDRIPSEISGRSEHGHRLAGHRHAYFLPMDLDRDGALEHVVIACRAGLSAETQEVLRDFTWFMLDGQRSRVTLERLGDGPDSWSWARTWRSATPFVPPRHPKLRGGQPRLDADGRWIEGPRWQLERELQLLGLPEPEDIQPIDSPVTRPWSAFQLWRRHGGGRRGPLGGHGFEIRFPEPVRGPIAVGYAAHFGLGQFHPVLS